MAVKSTDEECNENTPSPYLLMRRKTVTIRINPTLTLKQHNTTAFATLGFFAAFLVLTVIGGIFYFCKWSSFRLTEASL